MSELEVTLSYMNLKAVRRSSDLNPSINGMQPVNVPEQIIRSQAEYSFAGAHHIKLNAAGSYESKRMILADNSLQLPSWTTFNVGTSADFALQTLPLNLRVMVTNVFDAKYWKESPTYYDHVYLYAVSERNFTITATLKF